MILRLVGLRGIMNFARVSRAFRRVAKHSLLWKQLFLDRWPRPAQALMNQPSSSSSSSLSPFCPMPIVSMYQRAEKEKGGGEWEKKKEERKGVAGTDWQLMFKHRYLAEVKYEEVATRKQCRSMGVILCSI